MPRPAHKYLLNEALAPTKTYNDGGRISGCRGHNRPDMPPLSDPIVDDFASALYRFALSRGAVAWYDAPDEFKDHLQDPIP